MEWPGRAQIVPDTDAQAPGGFPQGSLTFYLDGAHTPESMEVCATWFCEAAELGPKKAALSKEAANSRFGSPSRAGVHGDGLQNGASLENGKESAVEGEEDGRNDKTGVAAADPVVRRVLLFNCMQEREPVKLLDPLVQIVHGKGNLPTCASS